MNEGVAWCVEGEEAHVALLKDAARTYLVGRWASLVPPTGRNGGVMREFVRLVVVESGGWRTRGVA